MRNILLTLVHIIDVSLTVPLIATSKFTLSLIGPDFTANKVNDPFQKLGPIAIFSARRHWTAPRSIRLQKGSIGTSAISADCRLHNANKKMAPINRHLDNGIAPKCTCPKVSSKGGSSDYGFHMRGDSPVIVCSVEANSLADVRKSNVFPSKPLVINVTFFSWVALKKVTSSSMWTEST